MILSVGIQLRSENVSHRVIRFKFLVQILGGGGTSASRLGTCATSTATSTGDAGAPERIPKLLSAAARG